MSRISFIRPSKTISISVTGKKCALNCQHCAGSYLNDKIGVDDLSGIERAPSYLITGGCDLSGRVPILEHLDKLAVLPEESTRIGHTGLIDEMEAEVLSDAIDVVSFDFVGDDSTIREIYGMDRSTTDYEMSYSAVAARIPTFPHLTIGLYKGKLAGEKDALEFLSGHGAKSIVLNVFMPTRGTPMESVSPPSLNDVREVVREARGIFDDVYLGCMRPGGSYRKELDKMAVDEGCDRIVNPSKPARELALSKGLEIEWKEECCVL